MDEQAEWADGREKPQPNMPPNDRCSFEVVYKKGEDGVEEIDHVVVRTGVSDAGVSLTITQVCNLARLLDIVQHVTERAAERGSSMTALPRAQAIRVE